MRRDIITRWMKHIAVMGVCALIAGSSSQAQPEEKTLLWKIEGDQIATSYLLGTIHLLPQSDFLLKEKVTNAFESTDRLVLELDIDSPSLQQDILQQAGMSDGTTLDKLLPEDAYAQIDSELQDILGVGLEPFNGFKPLLIASFLTAKYVGEKPASFESALMQMALEKGMEVDGLETVAEQMTVFDSISYEDQAADLVKMIEDEAQVVELYEKMLALYKDEDQAALYEMMGEYFDDPLQLELMIHKRNAYWVPRIAEKAKAQSTFFGVGAGHLGGEKGLLALLRAEGYRVTPVL